jgi:hypothetical protein
MSLELFKLEQFFLIPFLLLITIMTLRCDCIAIFLLEGPSKFEIHDCKLLLERQTSILLFSLNLNISDQSRSPRRLFDEVL